VLHSGYVLFNLVVACGAVRRGVPYVVMPHGAYDPHIRARRRVVRSLWEVAERWVLTRAAAVNVFFSAETEHVRRLAPQAVTITAPTAFETPERGWRSSGARGYVAWLGRYDVRHKGLDRLLDAMVRTPRDARPALQLRGRDHKDSRAAVERMVRERGLVGDVEVGGPVEGAAKDRFLLEAAAYVHPARWESYGIALVENLALGVPCLTTMDINLGPELERAGAALVVEGSVDGLSRGLEAIGRGDAVHLGPRGRDFVRTRLSHGETGRALLAAIDRVIGAVTR
jgi:glycosyltransferase involved in cell wall biosynthesis